MSRVEHRRVLAPRYNRRGSTFITLFWPKENSFIFNTYPKRRSMEYKLQLSNITQHAKRRKTKRVILFADHTLATRRRT